MNAEEENYQEDMRTQGIEAFQRECAEKRGYVMTERMKETWVAHKLNETREWAKIRVKSRATAEGIQEQIRKWEEEEYEKLTFEVDEKSTNPEKRIYAYPERCSWSDETDEERRAKGQNPSVEEL
jgi:hypothetical protein